MNHDKIIFERKEAIENLGAELNVIEQELKEKTRRIPGVQDVEVQFIGESVIPLVNTAAVRIKQQVRRKKKLCDLNNAATSEQGHESVIETINREFELMAKECDMNDLKQLETLIDQKMIVERSMQDFPYQIIGDNLDLYIKVKHMTSENQNK